MLLVSLMYACASIESTVFQPDQTATSTVSFADQQSDTLNLLSSSELNSKSVARLIDPPANVAFHLYHPTSLISHPPLMTDFEDWELQTFPGKKSTHYQLAKYQQTALVKATSNESVSVLRKRLTLHPGQYKSIKMAWKVLQPPHDAKITQANLDDSSMRLVLAFNGDKSKWSAKDAALSEISELMTGEAMPYATLMYVLCDECPENSVVMNQRTSRIRYIVVGKAKGQENKWQFLQRDIHEDYVKTFQETPGELVSLGIMTDSDNSKSSSSAWYGPVVLE